MPAANKVLVTRQIRNLEPLSDPDLGAVPLLTFLCLDEVGERTVLIYPTERKKTAETKEPAGDEAGGGSF